jgi:hypothetical protein
MLREAKDAAGAQARGYEGCEGRWCRKFLGVKKESRKFGYNKLNGCHMIKLHELRVGDIVLAEYEGKRSEGEVIALDREERKANIQSSVQDFWFDDKDLYPILLTEEQLLKFGFEKEEMADGSVKYKQGPFRILLSHKGDLSHFEMWYREDRRHITHSLNIHDLQNYYHEMTKIDLVRALEVRELDVPAH